MKMNSNPETPTVSAGIMTGNEICLELRGTYLDEHKNHYVNETVQASLTNEEIVLQIRGIKTVAGKTVTFIPENPASDSFLLTGVTIGIGFHWQKQEDQLFRGGLLLKSGKTGIIAINIVQVEDYLTSVISSEMSATSSPEMLKAHAVISRSWLLAQIGKGNKIKSGKSAYSSGFITEDEILRWYDREDHTEFDVCADDHCQRYQGITRASVPAVEEAVRQTKGEVLTFNDQLCDTRFSKCCGGITEIFGNAWEPVNHPYLQRVYDHDDAPADIAGDLTIEENAVKWILSEPPAFCNTSDHLILGQVLNDYDQKTHDFYRWKVTYSDEELGNLIKTKTGIDFGLIKELDPIQRGVSGRIVRLRITGSKKNMIIGKELEIRKALSETHLYSSAFVVEKTKAGDKFTFTLHGAGWGHGVGLCQIGAAVMGARGFSYSEILLHYYRGANIEKKY